MPHFHFLCYNFSSKRSKFRQLREPIVKSATSNGDGLFKDGFCPLKTLQHYNTNSAHINCSPEYNEVWAFTKLNVALTRGGRG